MSGDSTPKGGESLKAFILQLPESDIRRKEYFDLLHRIEDLEDEIRVVQWQSC